MVNFRKFILAVSLAAVVAGAAVAQQSVATPPAYAPQYLRAEGVTELLPTVVFSITTPPTATGTFNINVFTTAPVTSTPTGATVTVTDANQVLPANNPVTIGTVAGGSVLFTGVKITPTTTALTFDGIRVDASQIPQLLSGGSGFAVTGTFIALGTDATSTKLLFNVNGTNTPIYTLNNWSFATPSFSAGTADYLNQVPQTGDTKVNIQQCGTTPYDPTKTTVVPTPSFYVYVKSLFGGAFKTKTDEGAGATQATQFALSFSNVPSNVTLYVAPAVTGSGYVAAHDTTAAIPATLYLGLHGSTATAPVAVGSGVIYDVTGDNTSAIESAWIPVYVSFTGEAGLTTTAAPVTASIFYAPISTTSTSVKTPVPRFVGTATSSSAYTFTVSACNSTILFPYVVNTPGYDTGLAISNAGNLADNGGQSGTCQWSFYGDGAPTAAVAPTASIDPGTTNTALLSALAPGLNGFAVANCNFQGAYGYAFIVGKLGGNEVAQGYLGLLSGQTGTFGFSRNFSD